MKKTSLYSLAALFAAVCLPAGSLSQSVHASLADSRFVFQDVEIDPAILSADQFIELFCGTSLQRVLPDGSSTTEFYWYSSVTPENARTIANGKAVFDAMDAGRQAIVIQSARAFGVDYVGLAQAAVNYCAALDAPAAPVETPAEPQVEAPVQTPVENPEQKPAETPEDTNQAPADKPSQDNSQAPSADASDEKKDDASEDNKETNPADKADSTDSSTSSDSSAASDSSQGKDEGSKADSTKGDETSSDKTKPEEGVKPADPADKVETPDQDSQTPAQTPSENPEEKPADPSTETPAQTPAETPAPEEEGKDDSTQDGNTVEETKPDEYDYIDGNLNLLPSAKPKGMSILEYPDAVLDAQTYAVAAAIAQGAGWPAHVVMPVVYTYSANGTDVISSQTFYRVSINELMILFDYSVNEDGSVAVTIFTDGSCSYDMNSGVLSLPAIGSAVLNVRPAAETDTVNETAQIVTPVAREEIFQDHKKNPQIAVALSTEMEAAPVARVQDLSDQVDVREKLAIQNTTVLQVLDSQGNDFVAKYVTQNGAVIKSINASNYQQVLNGMQAWNSMSTTQRRAVNDYLIANGSTRFQTLYKQANEYRLGMPMRQESPAGSTSSSVNTGVEEDLIGAIGTFAVSAQSLVALGLYEIRSRRHKEKDKD